MRAGALGEVVSVDILRGSVYPPYEGGPLPPRYRDAGYPFRDLGIHGLYVHRGFLGPDREGRRDVARRSAAIRTWRSTSGARWSRCKRGLGQFQLSWNMRPMQRQIIIQGTKGVLRVDLFVMFHGKRASTPLPKAAERMVNAFTDSIQPLIDVPDGRRGVRAQGDPPYQGLRELVVDFYAALAAGEPPPVTVEDAVAVVRWTEKVARAADARPRGAGREVPALGDGAVPRHRRVGLARHGASSSGCAPTASTVARVRAPAARASRSTASSTCSATSAIRRRSTRAVQGAETVIHVGAAMKGGWPEHKGGTVDRHAATSSTRARSTA